MQLFDGDTRTDTREQRYSEGCFAFYNRIAGAYWQRVRDLLDEWFTRIPEVDRSDIRARFRSDDDRSFKAAFFEIYCHETLLRLGYEIQSHPEVPGTTRRPDYLAIRGTEQFVLEVTVVGESNKAMSAERRKDVIFDTINDLPSPTFFLGVTVHAEGPKAPPSAQLRSKLERWLLTLDPDVVAAGFDGNSLRSLPTATWEHEGWKVAFTVIPKSPQWRGATSGPTIGMHGPGAASIIEDHRAIQRQLADKAGAYGKFDVPYVIAASTETYFGKDTAIVSALFGSEQATVRAAPGGTPVVVPSRASNGLFIGPTGKRNRRVSGILVVDALAPTTIARTVPTLWHNPFATHPSIVSSTPWRHALVDETSGNLCYTDAFLTPSEFFDLTPEWPGPDLPFPDEQ
jgi:hypothetical protein